MRQQDFAPVPVVQDPRFGAGGQRQLAAIGQQAAADLALTGSQAQLLQRLGPVPVTETPGCQAQSSQTEHAYQPAAGQGRCAGAGWRQGKGIAQGTGFGCLPRLLRGAERGLVAGVGLPPLLLGLATGLGLGRVAAVLTGDQQQRVLEQALRGLAFTAAIGFRTGHGVVQAVCSVARSNRSQTARTMCFSMAATVVARWRADSAWLKP